ncbi:MAG: histidine kinase [Sphingorhabdus sp.]|jgi:two-component system, LytTR family, sensor kinase|uniref:sensor histidine kinase n=2 Tax=Sphingorhabdus sp. TaxID=1902408 RepID=UPI00273D3123|nr:histidine kinase [Sphingorhabdus sp.]MDP4757078.1 histidine kinase [Sphingorhabdus sp.]MDP4872271.1 histidine kinase [Sphingorhabdus sp.]MDP4926008.1 histidine kinase [Sphingorhabdus sp.]
MAILELSDKPFFADKNHAFWNLHSAGWGGATALYAVTVIANGQPLSFLVPVLISAVTGYSVTLILSVVYRYVIEKRPFVTWGTTLFAVMSATLLYAYIDTWVVQTIREGADQTPFAQLLLGALFKNGLLIGAWSALYYAINYFVRAEEQADQMMRLEAQATSAQLTMLRYQLNPHFLFNTLNSISTLVLLKQTDQANAMLSRLSSFLRFTLINEAAAKVPLTQEIETLKLYLDIEKMRFEERLRTFFTIEPAVQDALVPSLLLQPLVENAIKYAVTPKEEGADISVVAQLVGQRVRITVSDTGPGLQPGQQDFTLSTGVGMANTRERLLQAYGDDQRFEHYVKAGGGFEVLLELPYQTGIMAGDDNQAGAKSQGKISA